MRNVARRYLTAADDDAAAALADTHYRAATNMTDMIAGLAALTRMPDNDVDSELLARHSAARYCPLPSELA